MKVLFLPAAEAEHLEQVAYYESKQTGLGARYLAEVNAALEYIAEAPHRFRVVRRPALRPGRISMRWTEWSCFESVPLLETDLDCRFAIYLCL